MANRRPLYNTIIRRETLDKLKTVLNFKNYRPEIDSVALPTHELSVMQDH